MLHGLIGRHHSVLPETSGICVTWVSPRPRRFRRSVAFLSLFSLMTKVNVSADYDQISPPIVIKVNIGPRFHKPHSSPSHITLKWYFSERQIRWKLILFEARLPLSWDQATHNLFSFGAPLLLWFHSSDTDVQPHTQKLKQTYEWNLNEIYQGNTKIIISKLFLCFDCFWRVNREHY